MGYIFRKYIYDVSNYYYSRKQQVLIKYFNFRDNEWQTYQNYIWLQIPLLRFIHKNTRGKLWLRRQNIKFNPSLTWVFKINYYYISNVITKYVIPQTPYEFNFTLTMVQYIGNVRAWWKRTVSFGYYYIQGFIVILMIDACLIDDEPLWEPIEWSMVQTWILIIFLFGWIAEVLITSRYGSYSGRDKRVWMSWYKTFWLVEIFYMINFAVASSFIIIPFYFELNYTLPFICTCWNWYNRTFFLKFISLFVLVLLLSQILQFSVRWLHFKKTLILVLLINFFLSYLLYTQFIISFFGYITNPLWYQNNRTVDYIQLSHEPLKWGWGVAKHDHFTFHNSHTVFWFKNDGPFAASMMLFNMYIFLSLFFIYIYWVTLFRRIYSTKEVSVTYVTYCVSTLRQLLYSFMFLYFFIFISYITSYWRLPIELFWDSHQHSWFSNVILILLDYPNFIFSIINTVLGVI